MEKLAKNLETLNLFFKDLIKGSDKKICSSVKTDKGSLKLKYLLVQVMLTLFFFSLISIGFM